MLLLNLYALYKQNLTFLCAFLQSTSPGIDLKICLKNLYKPLNIQSVLNAEHFMRMPRLMIVKVHCEGVR